MRNILRGIIVVFLLAGTSQSVYAQSYTPPSNETVIEGLTATMGKTLGLDATVDQAWQDYLRIIEAAEFQDYSNQNANEMGSQYDMLTVILPTNAQEERIEFENEDEYVYHYQAEAVDDLSIHLYFYNKGLYATAFIASDDSPQEGDLLAFESVDTVVRSGWPTLTDLAALSPRIYGVTNMVKDNQLGSLIAIPSGDTLQEANLDFISFEAETFTNSIYFDQEDYQAIQAGDLLPMADQLVHYAIKDFMPSDALQELVTFNTTTNLGYMRASDELDYVLNNFAFRSLETHTQGDSLAKVKDEFVTGSEPVELELEEPLSGLAYQFAASGNNNFSGVLTLYFYEDQLAFASIEDVVSDFKQAQVNIDYTKGIAIDKLAKDSTLTPLTHEPIAVPAIGLMMKDEWPHQVAVIPVEGTTDQVHLVDIYNYRILGSENLQITDSTGELSDDLFQHIFNQY